MKLLVDHPPEKLKIRGMWNFSTKTLLEVSIASESQARLVINQNVLVVDSIWQELCYSLIVVLGHVRIISGRNLF